MIYHELGKTGITVSKLCFGSLTMGPFQRDLTPQEGAALFERAFELGVNFVDTAEIYGTYPHLREAVRLKHDLVVCSKSYAYDRRGAEESLKKALDGIGRDYIDVFLMHEQESIYTIRGHREALEYYIEMKKKGYIRAVGLSTHYIGCMDAAIRHPELEVLFPLINKNGIGIADGTTGEMLERIRTAHAQGQGIIAMKPLGGGHLIADREECLDFILNLDDCVDTIAIGMQSLNEVEYNCARFSGETPDPAVAEALGKTKRHLLIQEWCEGCGACVAACHNHALHIENGRAVVDHDKCALCGYCARACPQFTIKVI